MVEGACENPEVGEYLGLIDDAQIAASEVDAVLLLVSNEPFVLLGREYILFFLLQRKQEPSLILRIGLVVLDFFEACVNEATKCIVLGANDNQRVLELIVDRVQHLRRPYVFVRPEDEFCVNHLDQLTSKQVDEFELPLFLHEHCGVQEVQAILCVFQLFFQTVLLCLDFSHLGLSSLPILGFFL